MSSRSSIIGSVIIVIVVFSAVTGYIYVSRQYVPPDIAVVVRAPGFGDLSMADQVLQGLNELSGEMVVNYKYFTATDEQNAQAILETLSASHIYQLIVVIGSELSDELQTVAASYSNQKYALIGGTVSAPNIYSTTFALQEASFLAGVLAGVVSASNTNRTSIVGIIGSVETDPTVMKLVAGFKQGFYYANNTLDYSITLLPDRYVGSYNDSVTAEQLAKDMWNPTIGNASVIFAPVRASIMGIRNAMEYANKTWFCNTTNREPFVIAAEGDQDWLGLPNIETRTGSSWILTSVVPRSDVAVFRVINATLWGEFEGTTLRYRIDNSTNLPAGTLPIMRSMSDIGVNLTNFEYSDTDWVPNTTLELIKTIRTEIFYGTITVSETYGG